MKRLIALFLTLLTLAGLCACGRKPVEDKYTDTLEQARKAIGFEISAPEQLDGSGTRTFHVNSRTLEITYFSGKVMYGRITKADNRENLNGYDYGYTKVSEVTDSGVVYTLRGPDGSDGVCFAAWENGKYSYTALVSGERTPEEIIAFCKEIK